MYITPGHTAGTISTLIPVKDRGTPHLVAEWGGTLIGGLRPAAAAVLPPDDAAAFGELIDAWFKRLRMYKRLPGDHKGNPVARFIFKGAGVLDDSVI